LLAGYAANAYEDLNASFEVSPDRGGLSGFVNLFIEIQRRNNAYIASYMNAIESRPDIRANFIGLAIAFACGNIRSGTRKVPYRIILSRTRGARHSRCSVAGADGVMAIRCCKLNNPIPDFTSGERWLGGLTMKIESNPDQFLAEETRLKYCFRCAAGAARTPGFAARFPRS